MQKICPQGHRSGAVHTLVIPPPKRLPTGTTAETPAAPEEYVESFRRRLAEDGKSPKTIESYAGDVAGFLAHLSDVGEGFTGQIKRSHITGFRNHLLERGYEAATVNKKVNSLASFNRHLVATGLMEETVVDPRRDRVRVASGSERQVEVYTEGQIERLLHFVRGGGVSPRDRAIVMALLYTGVRVSELCGIRLRNLDLLTGSLTVTGKGGKVREVPLRPEVTDAALVKAVTALVNQLHNQLAHHYPSYRKFFSDVDGNTALAFWEEYPSPHLLSDTLVEDLAVLLRSHSHNACSTNKAKKILALVEKDGETKREYQEARDFIVRSIVRDVRFKKKEIGEVEKELKRTVDLLGYRLDTMPGIDTVTACALVSQIGDISRFSSADKLARFAGIAPIKFSSAGKGKDQKSKQGNRELHGIFYFLAIQQVQVSKGSGIPRNPVFLDYYQRKIREGKTKVQALVCVMRRLVNIIYGMMKHKTAYVMPTLPEQKAV